MHYTIKNIDLENKTVELTISLGGYFTLKEKGDLIKAEDLVGLSARQVQDKIFTNPNVSSVTVRFSPFWVRKVPRLLKNIKIEIQQN